MIIIVMAGFIFSAFYTSTSGKKIVYVNLSELYSGFEMKKQLENVYTNVQKGRQQQLDSMELELKLLSKTMDETKVTAELVEKFEAKKEIYLMKKGQFEQDDELMRQQYTDKIKKQLNQYVNDYGKEFKCDYILGAEGSGVLMYATDEDNITAVVLNYVNVKYKGEK